MTHDSPLMPTTHRPRSSMVRGAGSYLWDEHGRRYLDFVQGWAVNALGHNHECVNTALVHQLGLLVTPSPAYHNLPQRQLAQRLVELSGMQCATFLNSGAEANEAAIKLARKWGRRHKSGAFEIITTERAFHGRTLAAMAASGKREWDGLFPPNMPGFRRVPFGDLRAVQDAVTQNTVAVMLEPIQAEAGVRVPPPDYLQGLRRLTRDQHMLLIFDEVQTGIGRTGALFAKDAFAVEPDLMTLGKALGGGLPLAAVLASARAGAFEPGEHGSTFGGNPLCCTAGLAVLGAVGCDATLGNVTDRGLQLHQGLERLKRTFGCREARGLGLLRALQLAEPLAPQVRDAAFELGLLVNAAQPEVLRFVPSLLVSEAEISEALGLLEGALRQVLMPATRRRRAPAKRPHARAPSKPPA